MKVIVTGASKGIGRGIASFLAMDGHFVGLLARSEDLLDDLCHSLQEDGGACVHAACDLTRWDDARDGIESLIDQLGGIDALINNAGLVIRKNVFDLPLDDYHAMVNTNINGLFYATRAVLPAMREQRRGHIINISSISGKTPLPGGSVYAATKYAVSGFSASLFQEVREYNIKVTTLYPGSVDSASHRHDPRGDQTWKVTPEEIGQVCRDVLNTAPGTLIHEVEVRPLKKPG